ncbi:MAG: hypothetical protein WCQ45_04080 [bacterium]
MGRTGVRDLMFVGPLGGLGALRVMNGPFHTQDAESAKGARNGRVTVASHLVCDVRGLGTTSNPNVGDKLRRYTGEVHSVRRRRAASPSNRRTATTADAAQIFLGAIHHEVRQEV